MELTTMRKAWKIVKYRVTTKALEKIYATLQLRPKKEQIFIKFLQRAYEVSKHQQLQIQI